MYYYLQAWQIDPQDVTYCFRPILVLIAPVSIYAFRRSSLRFINSNMSKFGLRPLTIVMTFSGRKRRENVNDLHSTQSLRFYVLL